jgi:AcrR family transcriptional regulator
MSPRSSQADAMRTRERIVGHATDLASVEGLEGITIGRLASDLEMSKAGVIGQFGNKETLQLAATAEAERIFRGMVLEPTKDEKPGLTRLLAICDTWIDYVASQTFAGGCFWEAASVEMDGREGPVRDAIAASLDAWYGLLEREAGLAIERGEIDPGVDAEQLVFELRSLITGLNTEIQMRGNPNAPERARRAMRRVLGVT